MDDCLVIVTGPGGYEIGLADQFDSLRELNTSSEGNLSGEELFKSVREYLNELLITTTGDTQVLLIEDIVCPMSEKREFCEVFIKSLGCSSITFIPNALLCCISTSISDAMVLNVGAKYASCTPIIGLRIVDRSIMLSKRSERWLNNTFREKGSSKEAIIDLITDAGHPATYDDDDLPLGLLIRKVMLSLKIDTRRLISRNIILSGLMRDDDPFQTNLLQTLGLSSENLKSVNLWQAVLSNAEYLLNESVMGELRFTHDMFNEPLCEVPDWHELKYVKNFTNVGNFTI